MVDVLDPSGLTGFRQGPFRYSAEDSRFYLLTPDGAIPADGAPRGLLTLDDAGLSPIGADHFTLRSGRVDIERPASPAPVGTNAFEGQMAGLHWPGKVALAGPTGMTPLRALLDLDFLSGVLDSRITFTRASSAARVNASGLIELVGNNVSGFDYDPVTHAPRGLLVEPSGTNLLTQSEFVNGVTDAPSRAGLISATSFSGLISGTGLAFGYDGSTETRAYKSFSRTIGETYTFSVFVRMDDGLPPVFGHATSTNPANDFNIVTSGASGDAPPAYRIENYGSGLYRVSRVITQNTAGGNVGIIKYPTNSARTFKVSGYQLSSGASPTSYIPTGASAVTRAADSAVMSGTDFSDWFNAVEGTFIVEADHANPLGTSTCALAIDDGGNTNRFLLSAGSDGGLQAWAGANATASLGIITANTTFRAALTYSSAGVAGCMNGGAVQSAAMPALTGLNALRLGHRSSSGIGRWNGHFRCVRYIPRRVSNSELQGLTA